MKRRFSIATLLLLMAISAVAAASVRSAIVQIRTLPNDASYREAAIIMVLMGPLGALEGLILAFWNRSGPLRTMGCLFGGLFLGIAAGGQFVNRVDWTIIGTTPLVLLAASMLVAFSRRRRLRARDVMAAPNPVAR